MLPDLAQALAGFAVPPVIGYVMWRGFRRCRPHCWWWCSGAAGGMIGSALVSAWAQAAGDGLSLLLAVFLWWLSRRRRRRAPKAAGYKARALIATMTARMRQSAKPRPMPRLAPGGSHA